MSRAARKLTDVDLFDDIERRLARAERRLVSFEGRVTRAENFHAVGGVGEPAFQNGFTNFGGARAPAGFYINAESRVFLRGVVVGPGAGALPLTIFTLPAGYRPDFLHEFVVAHDSLCVAYVEVSGAVRLGFGALAASLALDVVSFRVTPPTP